MTSNVNTIRDEDGDSSDWIELFNNTSAPINLQNWCITDDSTEINKWIFPSKIIQPGEFLIVFASDKNRLEGPYLHTSFRLGAGRESVFLYNSNKEKIDEFRAVCIPSTFSFGNKPDGSGIKSHFTTPSPGSTNNFNPSVSITQGKDTVMFSQEGGFYTEAFSLQLAVNHPGTVLYYTTDGSEPDENATVYTNPISIESRKGQENVFSAIETSPSWIPPKEEVFKATVIRAVAYINGCPASGVFTHTYFVDPAISQKYTLPIISIATDRSNFFGRNNGIYVSGENDGLGENYYRSGDEWERPIHLEFFNTDGSLGFKQGLGARIHGRGSRGNPQKSVRVYARDKYGKERITYPIFPGLTIGQFKTLILRSPDADFSTTLFKDELVQTIIKDMNIDLQATQASIVFINGEYWGIHNIRERQDKHYVASHHGVDPDHLDMLGLALEESEIIEGDDLHYKAMLQYMVSNDLQDSKHYVYITTQMDIANFIDYQIAQLFFANFDWPHNNVRYWRPKTQDGKWRWFFFDCDACMVQDSHKHLYKYTAKDAMLEGQEQATFLLRNLLKNQQFRAQFLQRFMYHLNTTFEPGRIIRIIEEFKHTYSPEVFEHVYRWRYPSSYNAWLESLEEIKLFALQRPPEMLNQLTSLYKLPFSVYPNPSTGMVTIDFGEDDKTAVDVKLYTTQGQLIYEKAFSTASALKHSTINLSHIPNGLYVLKLQYGNLILNQKLLIHRKM